GESVFSGADAFKLYDTYGFPIDLTIEMVEEQGMTVDQDGFHTLMEEQRVRARKAREALGDLGWAGVEFGKDVPETRFVGYDHTSIDDAKVVALVVENEQAEEVMPGVEAIVVLDKTPFYAEMGGQVGDHGVISAAGMSFTVTDVQKNKGGKYMHYGKLTEGVLKLGDTVSASIDTERRHAIARAHSATHLLQKALQTVLGEHVHQAGSLVEPDFLRFDFTHFSAMTADELSQVEKLVNRSILEGYTINTEELPIEQAKQKGAMALFGEKYGDVVRVVDMGGYSVEFCGGTHLPNTAMVGPFRIESEFSVASGVRRIEAITGRRCLAAMDKNREMLFQAAEALKAKPGELIQKAQAHMEEMRSMRSALEKYKAKEALGEAERFLFSAHEVGSLRVLTSTVPNADANKLRQMGDMLRDKAPNIVAVLAAVKDEKITFLAVCGKEAVAKGVKAGDIIKQVCAIAGGSGGGKPDSAMGGGKDILMLDNALAMVDNFVSMKLGL
ncbi:MAG: alanine--tRNA ligase, partial [Oscillospiraceae bacterium]